MRDTIQLATDVHIPRDINNSLPIVLIRTPYNKNNIGSFIQTYTQRGYIVVIQDTRGFHGSEGEKGFPFSFAQVDGHDTLSWLEKQPWSNKKVGTWGGSALGITQYLMAPNAPESLKCQLPIVGSPDLYNVIFKGGQLRRELIIPWMEGNGYSEEAIMHVILNEKLSEIWDPMRIQENYEQVNTASMHFGGWYDIFSQGTIDAFLGYQYKGGDLAQGNAKLVMGPWLHGNFYGGPTGEMEFPNQDAAIVTNIADAVFDKWLRGDSTLWDHYPTILFYLMSSVEYNPSNVANRWYRAEGWPISVNTTDLYLSLDEGSEPYGLLGTPNDPVYNSVEWEWNPENPIVTIGGNNLVIAAGIYDQAAIENRSDIIIFETPELSEALTVVGQINITLYVSSNCTDTDITVKLTDVYPDGRSMLVTDTILRVRNRNTLSDWEFMEPDTIYGITIPLESTAYLFNVEHQIRLIISSSNYPRFETNPNTGDPLWQNNTYFVAKNKVYCNTTHPSLISLPTVDYGSLQQFVF